MHPYDNYTLRRSVYKIKYNCKFTLLEYLQKVKYNTDIFRVVANEKDTKLFIAYTK